MQQRLQQAQKSSNKSVICQNSSVSQLHFFTTQISVKFSNSANCFKVPRAFSQLSSSSESPKLYFTGAFMRPSLARRGTSAMSFRSPSPVKVSFAYNLNNFKKSTAKCNQLNKEI